MAEFPAWAGQLRSAYADIGITRLFEWQAECLADASLSEPHFSNLVYSAPTSAGKTLVAELLAAHNAITTNRRVFFLFPYVSTAREKLHSLKKLWRKWKMVVQGFMGGSTSSVHGWRAAVCTMEKASSLINSFIEAGTINEIGTVVIDEAHMLFDTERGPVLEYTIAKLLYLIRHCGAQIQIICMSATLDEPKVLADWIGAKVYTTLFRPLKLSEYVLIEDDVYSIPDGTNTRQLAPEYRVKADSTRTLGITMEAILTGNAVLVFCPTKAEVETTANLIARYISHCLSKGENNRFSQLKEIVNTERLKEFAQLFTKKTRSTDKTVPALIQHGVAFHHAGLMIEEREEIESLFRYGILKVLVATSTLSAGVNLPAHRVIIRGYGKGRILLNWITYKQMAGRAGRQGQSTTNGESYLLCTADEWTRLQRQIERTGWCQPSRSMSKLILEGIGLDVTRSVADVEKLVETAFSQPTRPVAEELQDLQEQRLLSLDDSGNAVATQLGRATLASSLQQSLAIRVYNDLQNAMRSLCLDSELHMLFLVTPINNLAISEKTVDWNKYHQKWAKLDEPLRRVADRVGVSERFIIQRLAGQNGLASTGETLNTHLRFLAALVLFELVNEKPLAEVSAEFKMNRGVLQSLQQQAATYAFMVVAFCDRLGWFYVKTLLDGFCDRLQFGVRRDLTDLVRISGIDAVRARVFHQHKICSVADLAAAAPEEVRRVLRKAVPFDSRSQMENGKNVWLFQEPALYELDAAQILINRAGALMQERIRSIMPPVAQNSAALEELITDLKAPKNEEDEAVSEVTRSVRRVTLSPSRSRPVLEPVTCVSDSDSDSDTQHTDPLPAHIIVANGVQASADEQVNGRYHEHEASGTPVTPNDKHNSHFNESSDLFNQSASPVSVQNNSRAASKKTTWVDRVSKGMTPPGSPSSPLTKTLKALPASVLNDDTIVPLCRCNQDHVQFEDKIGVSVSPHGVIVLCTPDHRFYHFTKYGKSNRCNVCPMNELEKVIVEVLGDKCQLKLCYIAREISRHMQEAFTRRCTSLGSFLCLQTIASLKHPLEEIKSDAFARVMALSDENVPQFIRDKLRASASRQTAAVDAFLALHYTSRLLTQDIKLLAKVYSSSWETMLRVELRGFEFDTELCTEIVDNLPNELAKIERQVHELAGFTFDVGSSHQVSQALFEKMRLEIPHGTEFRRGRVRVSKSVLEKLNHPVAELIMAYRRLEDCMPHLRGFRQSVPPGESRVHTVFDELATNSGRIISKHPNVQAVPKSVTVNGKAIRSMFIASPGMYLVAGDYSQLELRVLCQLSADDALYNYLNDKSMDPFERMALEFGKRTSITVDRGKAKQVCYAMIYGMGAETLSTELSVSKSEAQDLINAFYGQFPGVRCWMDTKVQDCRMYCYVETYLGRRRMFDLKAKDGFERQAINHIIQGTAAEIFRQAIISVDEGLRKLGGGVVMQIHDEIIAEVPEASLEAGASVLKSCMERSFPEFNVHFPIKLSYGRNWGELASL